MAPTVRCAKAHAEKLHGGIQVKPNTRPSLRSGLTAYAVLSREPSSFWPPSLPRNSRTPRRLTRMPPPRKLDRSNGRPGPHGFAVRAFACSPQSPAAWCTQPPGYWRDELSAPLVGTKPRVHGEQSALPAHLTPDAAASTASPARETRRHMIAPQGRAGMADTYDISEFR